jgi:hypothetical protein
MPLKYSSYLNSNVNWTDEEIAAGKKYLKWEEMTIKWENVDLLWEEVFILLEVEQVIKKGGGYGYKEYVDGNPWKQVDKELGEEKTKKLIKLFCRVNGVEYDETREVDDEDIKISVNDFERFIKDSVEIKIKATPQ